jgi:hypothetical protein
MIEVVVKKEMLEVSPFEAFMSLVGEDLSVLPEIYFRQDITEKDRQIVSKTCGLADNLMTIRMVVMRIGLHLDLGEAQQKSELLGRLAELFARETF